MLTSLVRGLWPAANPASLKRRQRWHYPMVQQQESWTFVTLAIQQRERYGVQARVALARSNISSTPVISSRMRRSVPAELYTGEPRQSPKRYPSLFQLLREGNRAVAVMISIGRFTNSSGHFVNSSHGVVSLSSMQECF